MDDKNIVMLRHHHKNLPLDSQFYRDQCDDLDERIVIDVTSRNRRRDFARQISPMFIGPVITGDGMDAKSFELYWQCSKVYPCQTFMGEPTEEYWNYRRKMFSIAPDDLGILEKRHPEAKLGAKSRDCVFSIWYNKETGEYEKLGYKESRRKEYIIEYALLVHDSDAMKELKALYDSGKKLAFVDFDTYNYYNEGKTIVDVFNEDRRAGHGYVMKMLIEGDIEVVDGKVIDHVGVLVPEAPVEQEFTHASRETPERMTSLESDEIFVFGSDVNGNHLRGAAKTACQRFGAVMGQGVGLQGRSYAIPTMAGGVETIRPYVDEFVAFAGNHPEMKFYVTRIGCGIAGYTPEEIAPLFASVGSMENVCLPSDFWAVINSNRHEFPHLGHS